MVLNKVINWVNYAWEFLSDYAGVNFFIKKEEPVFAGHIWLV